MGVVTNPDNGSPQATLHTSNGDITVNLFPNQAPKTVSNFVGLATGEGQYSEPNAKGGTSGPFYDGTIFHRVVPGFMAQGGDPTGTGEGGSKLPDLKSEFNSLPHLRGTVAAARTADSTDSANSQFYIMFGPDGSLDRNYTVFGRVISGMDAVDKIAPGQPPAEPTKIVKASIGG